jgi:exosortase
MKALASPPDKQFAYWVAALSALFAAPLYQLFRLALRDEFSSYILLIPVIAVYLASLRFKSLPAAGPRAWPEAGVLGLAGLAAAGLWLGANKDLLTLAPNLSSSQLLDARGFALKLRQGGSPLAESLWRRFTPASKITLSDPAATEARVAATLAAELNARLNGEAMVDAAQLDSLPLRKETRAQIESARPGGPPARFNRRVLEDCFPGEIAAHPLRSADGLAGLILAYVLLVWAGAYLFWGRARLGEVLLPAGLLIFLTPFPGWLVNGMELFFQKTSADATQWLFDLTRTTYSRSGQVFDLPGISLVVAQECSGVRSSLVLFITGLIAGNLFLKSAWAKGLLAFMVIPLGILRNGFRIFVIAQLCVHVNPNMIDSYIHRQGGPVFFALSLIPFFALIAGLRWWEKRGKTGSGAGG